MQWDAEKELSIDGHTFHAMHVTDLTYMGEDYVTTGPATSPFWAVYAPTIGDVVRLAGRPGAWDAAVPQPWHDAHRQDIADHGGFVVWHYPPGNMFGNPMFADELYERAADTVRELTKEA